MLRRPGTWWGRVRWIPGTPDPVARIQAVQVRAPTAATIRAQLLTRSWQSAWGGRAITAATSVTVDPSVPAAEVVGLEQALGIEPTVEKLPCRKRG